MNKKLKLISSGFAIIFIVFVLILVLKNGEPKVIKTVAKSDNAFSSNPLSISAMQKKIYPGSDLKIEEELAALPNYSQAIASYQSEGNKIFGLLLVPSGTKPKTGWPVVILLHGHFVPSEYQTIGRYVQYAADLANAGFIVFKPDYRGHGNSEGKPESAYFSPAYTIDVLNAVASIKKYQNANPNLIGLWAHSMGGTLAERAIAVDTNSIKAAVIWGGVVGTYEDWLNQRGISYTKGADIQKLIKQSGKPNASSSFWQAIDPALNLKETNTPVQLHHGEADESVPISLSKAYYKELKNAGKIAEIYTYPGGDHNISSPNYEIAMQRSIEFFKKYLK